MKKYLASLCGCLVIPIAFSAEIIISTGDPGTSSTGRWSAATGASMPYAGNRGVFSTTWNGVSTYTFTPTLPTSTEYTVEVYNSCYSPRSHQVIHRISHAGGIDELSLEQDCRIDPYVGQWRTLGTYNFNEGNTGSLTIDTTGSNNRYIGATAARFISNDSAALTNIPPSLTPSSENVSVNENTELSFSATAYDTEDGDISHLIQWEALGQTGSGNSFSVTTGDQDFWVNLTVRDFASTLVTSNILITVIPDRPILPQVNEVTPLPTPTVSQNAAYDFSCDALEPLPSNFITNNAQSLPQVGMRCGQYVAELTDNTDNITLHYYDDQGRFDGVPVSFPFKVIARNVGIAPINNTNENHAQNDNAYIFSGLQVHHSDFDRRNSAHVVVGQRGNTRNTIEGKTTQDSRSRVSDIGSNQLPSGRADLMIEGDTNGQLIVSWQIANTSGHQDNDNWQLYNGTGRLPGIIPDWGNNPVYIGLITYAQGGRGIPFSGVADSLEIGD